MRLSSPTTLRSFVVGTLSVAACSLTILLSPATARAANVECSNAFGSCTVSNDGSDSISCTCDGGGGDGGTGGNDWAGLSEAELMEICEAELAYCYEGLPTTGEPDPDGTTGVDTWGTDTGGTDSWGTDTGGGSGSGDGTDGVGTDGDPGSDSGTAGETAGGDSGSVTAGGDDAGGTGGDSGGQLEGDGGSGSGGSDASGRGCSMGTRGGMGILALLCLGVLGFAGRRRDEHV